MTLPTVNDGLRALFQLKTDEELKAILADVKAEIQRRKDRYVSVHYGVKDGDVLRGLCRLRVFGHVTLNKSVVTCPKCLAELPVIDHIIAVGVEKKMVCGDEELPFHAKLRILWAYHHGLDMKRRAARAKEKARLKKLKTAETK